MITALYCKNITQQQPEPSLLFSSGPSGTVCYTPRQTARRNQTWWCQSLSLVQNLSLGWARSPIWDQYQVTFYSLHVSPCMQVQFFCINSGTFCLLNIIFIKFLLNLIFKRTLWCKLLFLSLTQEIDTSQFGVELLWLRCNFNFQRLLRIPMERTTIKARFLCSPKSNEATPRLSQCGLRLVDYRYYKVLY